jgi:hypothetical protein
LPVLSSDHPRVLRGSQRLLRQLLRLKERGKMKELFIEDLKKVKGGVGPRPCTCCHITTQACCEETGCDTCCATS